MTWCEGLGGFSPFRSLLLLLHQWGSEWWRKKRNTGFICGYLLSCLKLSWIYLQFLWCKQVQTVQLLQRRCWCVWMKKRVHAASGPWVVYVLQLTAQTGSEWAPCAVHPPPMLGMRSCRLGSTPKEHTQTGMAMYALTPRRLSSVPGEHHC